LALLSQRAIFFLGKESIMKRADLKRDFHYESMITSCLIKNMAEEKEPRQEEKQEKKQDNKQATKSGGYTIPVQMC
jgi:hypothetical protein